MSRGNDLERKGSRPMNKIFSNLGRHLILIIGALTILIPFLWMITTSLQTKAETYTAQSIFPNLLALGKLFTSLAKCSLWSILYKLSDYVGRNSYWSLNL